MSTGPTVQLGSVTIHLDDRRIHSPRGDEALSDREARLLAFLVEHRGHTQSRERLLTEVWGYSPRVQSRAVDHTVARLRKKVEVDPTRPVWIQSVRGAGYRLVNADEAARSRPPAPYGGFVGRQAELAAVQDARKAGHRLITLQGPPGIGKTRLCRELLRVRSGESAFVPLIDATDAASVLVAVATGLDVPLDRQLDVEQATQQIAGALAHRPGLTLALDNAEHLVAVLGPLVRCWLVPEHPVELLVTSRRPLGIEAETAVRLRPMPAPDAVALMIDRARQVRGAWDPTPGERAQLAEIAVDQLDGLPLALELAAARLAVLDVAGLADRLNQRFRLLVGGRTDAPWASLEAALRWSWDLLTEAERATLAQCTVFVGGFTLEAAEAVVEPGEGWVPDVITSLVDHALLQRSDDDPPRFTLLESVRALAVELGGVGDAPRRHRDWFARGVAARVDLLQGPRAAEVAPQLVVEMANLEAAHAAAVAAGDVARAVPIAECIYTLNARRGPDQRSVAMLEQTLADMVPSDVGWVDLRWRHADALRQTHRYDEAGAVLNETLAEARTPAERAKVLTATLPLLIELGDEDGFGRTAAEALREAREAGDLRRQQLVRHNQATWEWAHGSLEAAERWANESARLNRETQDPVLEVAGHANLMLIAEQKGDFPAALAHAEAGMALSRTHDFPKYRNYLGVRRASILAQGGHTAAALAAFDEQRTLAARRGDRPRQFVAELYEVDPLIDAGELDRATSRIRALEVHPAKPAWVGGFLELLDGLIERARGNAEAAEARFRRAVACTEDSEGALPRTRHRAMAHLAGIRASVGDVDEAQRWADRLHEEQSSRGSPVGRALVDAVRVRVLEARVARLREEASALEAARGELCDALQGAGRDVLRVAGSTGETEPRH